MRFWTFLKALITRYRVRCSQHKNEDVNMYLRPDEVARVLEKAGFTVDVVTNKTCMVIDAARIMFMLTARRVWGVLR